MRNIMPWTKHTLRKKGERDRQKILLILLKDIKINLFYYLKFKLFNSMPSYTRLQGWLDTMLVWASFSSNPIGPNILEIIFAYIFGLL